MSAIDRALRRLARARDGASAVSFALIAPVLVAFSLALVEFALLAFDYHRAGEATRRGGRTASILDPIGEVSVLDDDLSVLCTKSGDTVSCTNTTVLAADNFDAVLATIQEVMPRVAAENVEVEYQYSGIGDLSTPGGIMPLVTVRLKDVSYTFGPVTVVPGMPASITLPPFATTQLAGGYKPA